MRILVVEDDDLVADAIAQALRADGFSADRATSGEQALAMLASEHFDLAVLDLGLPGRDGVATLRQLRGGGARLPVMILTARDGLDVKVQTLNLGADDFLAKPFEPMELVARCRALIRRAHLASSGELTLGRARIDLGGHQLCIDGQPVELTSREWAVLECLALNAGRLVSKARLQEAVMGFDNVVTPNALEVYISRLRAKLAAAALIRTVRGLGYRLDEPA